MLALSIRQPYAELILRGIKTAEFRTRATKIVGQRFHIYASRSPARSIWSRDLGMPSNLPQWMIELAEQMKLIPPGTELPTGVIVGSAVIERCEEIGTKIETERRRDEETECADGSSSTSSLRLPVSSSLYKWHLTDVQRATNLRKPDRHPQPVWFKPF